MGFNVITIHLCDFTFGYSCILILETLNRFLFLFLFYFGLTRRKCSPPHEKEETGRRRKRLQEAEVCALRSKTSKFLTFFKELLVSYKLVFYISI